MDELITAVFVLILVLLIATVGVIMIVGEPISQYQVTCADPDYEITVSGFRTLIGNYALETEGCSLSTNRQMYY